VNGERVVGGRGALVEDGGRGRKRVARRGEADLGMLRGLRGEPVWHGVSPCVYSRAHTYANDSFSLRHNAIALLAGMVAMGPSGGEMPALVSYTIAYLCI